MKWEEKIFQWDGTRQNPIEKNRSRFCDPPLNYAVYFGFIDFLFLFFYNFHVIVGCRSGHITNTVNAFPFHFRSHRPSAFILMSVRPTIHIAFVRIFLLWIFITQTFIRITKIFFSCFILFLLDFLLFLPISINS